MTNPRKKHHNLYIRFCILYYWLYTWFWSFNKIGFQKIISPKSNIFLCVLRSDSPLPKVYILCKDNVSFWIIVSSINAALYSFAFFLHKIISEFLSRVVMWITILICAVRSLTKLLRVQIDFFDVLRRSSTFYHYSPTLDLRIEGIGDRWTFKQKIKIKLRTDFISVIKFVLSLTYFTSNNLIYKQTFKTRWVLLGYQL